MRESVVIFDGGNSTTGLWENSRKEERPSRKREASPSSGEDCHISKLGRSSDLGTVGKDTEKKVNSARGQIGHKEPGFTCSSM